MTDLVKFTIPAEYVLARAMPTLGELAYGYRREWLSADGAVTIALAHWEAGRWRTGAESDLALLTHGDLDRVPDLIWKLDPVAGSQDREPERLWLFLALSWMRDHREQFGDVHAAVAMLYADFGYPETMEGFVGYMPPPPGAEVGLPALDERWRLYVEREAGWFQTREVTRS